jgi:predicted kinase
MRQKAPRPLMIAVGGLSGSGKTTLARGLRDRMPGSVMLDSDEVRKEMHGVSPETPLPDSAYTPENTAAFIQYIRSRAETLLRQNKTVIVAGLFLDNKSRFEQQSLAERCGAGFIGLYIDVPLGVLYDSVAGRKKAASDADRGVVERQVRAAVNGQQGLHWHVVDGNRLPDDVLRSASAVVLHELRRFRLRDSLPPKAPNGPPGPMG